MSKVYDNVSELVGNTPLVRLNSLTKDLDAEVLVKLEYYNPANSVKVHSNPGAPLLKQRPVTPASPSPWSGPHEATK